MHAAAEGTDFVRQAIKVDDFGQLFGGERFPHEMSEFYFLSLEELNISAQQNTLPLFRHVGQFSILPLRVVECFETGHPQLSGEFSHIGVYQEADGSKRIWSQQAGSKDVDRRLMREDCHRTFFLNDMIKGDKGTVDLDGSDFSVRYAKGFNDIFDGSAVAQGWGEQAIATSDSFYECCQPAVKLKINRNVVHGRPRFISVIRSILPEQRCKMVMLFFDAPKEKDRILFVFPFSFAQGVNDFTFDPNQAGGGEDSRELLAVKTVVMDSFC
jgi:hypothetical protein